MGIERKSPFIANSRVNDIPRENLTIKKSIQNDYLTCFEKNETFFEQIGNAVPGSFHEQRPKWCPVDFNSYEHYPA